MTIINAVNAPVFYPNSMNTATRLAFTPVAQGALVYDSDIKAPFVYQNSEWEQILTDQQITQGEILPAGVTISVPSNTPTSVIPADYMSYLSDGISIVNTGTLYAFQFTLTGTYIFNFMASYQPTGSVVSGGAEMYLQQCDAGGSVNGQRFGYTNAHIFSSTFPIPLNCCGVLRVTNTSNYYGLFTYQNTVGSLTLGMNSGVSLVDQIQPYLIKRISVTTFPG